MPKINIDIDYITNSLSCIGYEIADLIENENNGIYWQIKFSNSEAIVTVYDTNKTNNTVVNGKASEEEKEKLKIIVDSLKSKELVIDALNKKIVQLIKSKKEDYYYDFKKIVDGYNYKLLHDILCLSNNLENKEAYLIIGVADNYEVVGIDRKYESHNIFDFLKGKKFAGDHIPDIEILEMYYKYKKIVVIKCNSSKHVPFYLLEDVEKVKAYSIYTRLGDTNTPLNSTANYSQVEKLWRIHFEREKE